MFVECTSCAAKLSWNHKRDRQLSELSCPHCGGGYRKSPVSFRADPFHRHDSLVMRFQRTVERLEAALVMARELAPALAEIGELLSEIRLPHLLDGDADTVLA